LVIQSYIAGDLLKTVECLVFSHRTDCWQKWQTEMLSSSNETWGQRTPKTRRICPQGFWRPRPGLDNYFFCLTNML